MNSIKPHHGNIIANYSTLSKTVMATSSKALRFEMHVYKKGDDTSTSPKLDIKPSFQVDGSIAPMCFMKDAFVQWH